MKKRFLKAFSIVVVSAVGGWLCSLPGTAEAAFIAGQCSNCHVMHNSQAGVDVNATPQDTLLTNGCLGCHTGDNGTGTTLAGSAPFVLTDATAAMPVKDGVPVSPNNILAGGNFEYANTDQTYGHNPVELGAAGDTRYKGTALDPPGWVATGYPDPDGKLVGDGAGIDWNTNGLSCAGVYGCHGRHDSTASALGGAHHDNGSGSTGTAPATVGQSYRFLYGIEGWEDADYGLNATSTDSDHNVYRAEARADETIASNRTISYACAQCHGVFHSGTGVAADNAGLENSGTFSTPWVRHPVDFVMPTAATEYANYAAYDPIVPVGSSSITDGVMAVGTAPDRIVMCLSCHRAHASPYPAALRWDPTIMVSGTTGAGQGKGCFACHTAKDG